MRALEWLWGKLPILVLLIVVACSSGQDLSELPSADSSEATDDSHDDIQETPNAGEILPSADTACEPGLSDNDCGSLPDQSVPTDVSKDAQDCSSGPREGCPCHDEEPCCLQIAEGLNCETIQVGGEIVTLWVRFNDCGCIEGPPCESYELYPYCGSSSE